MPLVFSEERALIEIREGLCIERVAGLFGMRVEDLEERLNCKLYHLYKSGFTVEDLLNETGLPSEEIRKRLDFEIEKRKRKPKNEPTLEALWYRQYITGFSLETITYWRDTETVHKALKEEAERRGVEFRGIIKDKDEDKE